MPRKNARPAAKKRRAKLAALQKSGRRAPRRPSNAWPPADPGLSMGLAMAALGAHALRRRSDPCTFIIEND